MARGQGGAPWWAWIVIVVGVAVLAVGIPLAGRRHAEPLSRAEVARMSAAEAAASKSEEAARPKVLAYLGDSFGEGTGANDPATTGMATQIAQQMGWLLHDFSQGGTGYVSSGPVAGRKPFPDRVPSVVAAHPDVVIVAGGINDANPDYTEQQVSDAVTKTLHDLQAGLPGVPIVVVGPFWPNGFPVPAAELVNRVEQTVTGQLGLPYVSPIDEQWITGSNDGKVPGNRTQYIGPDGTHPTQAGHDYLAGQIVAFLRTVQGLPTGAAR